MKVRAGLVIVKKICYGPAMFPRLRMFRQIVGMMNRAYDKDSRKLFRRIRAYLEAVIEHEQADDERHLIDQIDLLLGDREPPFDMDDAP